MRIVSRSIAASTASRIIVSQCSGCSASSRCTTLRATPRASSPLTPGARRSVGSDEDITFALAGDDDLALGFELAQDADDLQLCFLDVLHAHGPGRRHVLAQNLRGAARHVGEDLRRELGA